MMLKDASMPQVEYHVTGVNGTYWKDPSFPSDPDNWVYAPMVRRCMLTNSRAATGRRHGRCRRAHGGSHADEGASNLKCNAALTSLACGTRPAVLG